MHSVANAAKVARIKTYWVGGTTLGPGNLWTGVPF
jgi:hypothetical protein